jgi:hypothetical protein
MSVCAGVKRSGGRCTAPPLPGEDWCYGHHPEYADRRRRNAAKSHKTRSASPEIGNIKQRLSELAEDVLDGAVDKGVAAVVSQVYNVYLRAIGIELKVREVTELEERLEELEASLERQNKGRRYGA